MNHVGLSIYLVAGRSRALCEEKYQGLPSVEIEPYLIITYAWKRGMSLNRSSYRSSPMCIKRIQVVPTYRGNLMNGAYEL